MLTATQSCPHTDSISMLSVLIAFCLNAKLCSQDRFIGFSRGVGGNICLSSWLLCDIPGAQTHRSMSAFPKWSSWEWLISTWPRITSLALSTVSSVPVLLLTSLVIAFPLCSLKVGGNFILKKITEIRMDWGRAHKAPSLVKELQVVWWLLGGETVFFRISPQMGCLCPNGQSYSRMHTGNSNWTQ